MDPKRCSFGKSLSTLSAMVVALAIVPGDTLLSTPSPLPSQSSAQAPKIPPDQLDSLVAPIALYPDPLLAQTLAASTYPLELIQLQQWLLKNPGLKDQALADAVAKQPWDPSIQALAGLPDVVKRLGDDIQWTTDLGNAFLAQQGDVMDAVQRMRKKAQDNGNLKSGEQQRVETKVIENKSVIVVEQSNPQVVYVPSYDPLVVWGAPLYPYPPIYYPPAGYYAAGLAISFGVGMMMGAFWSGGWGWGCGWGNNNININNNNNFNRNSNIGGNRNNIGGGNRPSQQPGRGGIGAGRGDSSWRHNPQHLGRQGGNLASNRAGDGRLGNRAGGGLGAGNRLSGGGPNSIGGRDLTRGGAGNRDAFGGGSRGSRGYNGSSARANSSRGASSRGSRSGGFGGGGGRGGGGRRR